MPILVFQTNYVVLLQSSFDGLAVSASTYFKLTKLYYFLQFVSWCCATDLLCNCSYQETSQRVSVQREREIQRERESEEKRRLTQESKKTYSNEHAGDLKRICFS